MTERAVNSSRQAFKQLSVEAQVFMHSLQWVLLHWPLLLWMKIVQLVPSKSSTSWPLIFFSLQTQCFLAFRLTFGNFQLSGSTAQWFTNVGTNNVITQQASQAIAGDGSVTITFPANSVSMIVVQGTPGANGGPLPPPASSFTTSTSSSASSGGSSVSANSLLGSSAFSVLL